MLAVVVLLNKQLVHGQIRINGKGYECHLGALLHHFGVVHRVVRRSSPRERTVILHQDCWCVIRVNLTDVEDFVHNDIASFQFVLTFHLNFDQALGDYLRLQSDFRMNTSQRYGYLTLLPTQPERIENRQSSMNPRENLTLSFDHNWLKASIFAEINADRLRYTASPEQNTTHWNNNFGLRIEATHGNFFFYTSLTERTYRGYTISSMNRNILAWDGSVGWNILKKKARLMLEFNDILNNEDGRMSQQTAYQQTTSWREFRHHYVGLSFRYHLDAKVKE